MKLVSFFPGWFRVAGPVRQFLADNQAVLYGAVVARELFGLAVGGQVLNIYCVVEYMDWHLLSRLDSVLLSQGYVMRDQWAGVRCSSGGGHDWWEREYRLGEGGEKCLRVCMGSLSAAYHVACSVGGKLKEMAVCTERYGWHLFPGRFVSGERYFGDAHCGWVEFSNMMFPSRECLFLQDMFDCSDYTVDTAGFVGCRW